MSSSTSNDAFNGAIFLTDKICDNSLAKMVNARVDNKIVSQNSHMELAYLFRNKRFANFMCFGRGDRHN